MKHLELFEEYQEYEEANERHDKGDLVRWSTLGGDHFRGVVTDRDLEVLYVMCTDGQERCCSTG